MKLEFIIHNTTNSERSAVLLGFNENMLQKNFGSDDGIEINCLQNDFKQLPYKEVIAQMSFAPSFIKSVMFESFYVKNKELVVHYVHRNANGYVQNLPIKLIRNKRQEVPVVFDGNTSIKIQSPPNSKIMFIIDDGKSQYLQEEMDKRKLLLK